ncbi:hypothetical protein TNCV_1440041 [Trichonephila clavipes]|nr:hypothetical protein TNCV_1440041 [Trichonephila clavipes]
MRQYDCSYTPRWCYNQEEGAIKASANSKIHKRDDYPPIVGRLWSSGHEKVPTCGKPGLERPGRPRGERIEGSWGKHLWTPH